MNRILVVWALMVMATIADAHAQQVRVTLDVGTPSPLFFAPGQTVNVPIASTTRRINIETVPSTAQINIGPVFVSGTVPAGVAFEVVLGVGAVIQTDSPPTPIGSDWAGLNISLQTTPPGGIVNTRFGGAIRGNLTGPISGVRQISRFDAGGEIGSSIQVASGINGGTFVIEAGSFAATSSIRVTSGQISRVQSNSGSMLGSITIDSGFIARVRALGGSIGASISALNGQINEVAATFGSISSPTITASTSIGTIDAGGTVSSVITAGGNLQRLQITSGNFTGSLNVGSVSSAVSTDGIRVTSGSISGPITIAGDVSRPIVASQAINNPLTIGGNLTSTLTAASLNADLRVNETLSGSLTVTGGLPAARTIRIGDGFSGTITLPGTASLAGQITINADQKAPTGTWTGTVSIGTNPNPVVTLSAPPDGKYTQLPASLGGGSVGLAPFRLHEPACTPPHNAVAVGQGVADGAFGTGLFPVRIRHYGPVRFVGTARPTVQARVSESDPCQWIDLAGFAFRGPGDAGWTDPNSIGVGAANGVLIKQGIYRVIFNSGTLVSDVTNSPDVVWPVICDLPSYVFRVFCDSNLDLVDDSTQSVACTTDCYRVDFNGNGFVSPPDIFDFLNAYFNAATPISTIDFDNNGVKGPSDIFAYLNAYFGCPK